MTTTHSFNIKTSLLILASLVSIVFLLRTPSTSSLQVSYVGKKAPNHRQILGSVADACVNVDANDTFTDGEIQQANSINDYLLKIRGSNPILDFAMAGGDAKEFGVDYAKQLIPFVAFGGVLLLLSCTTICCICCDYKCFRSCSNPKAANKLVCTVIALILTVAMAGGSAAGWYFAKDLNQDFRKTNCAGAHFIGDFSTGVADKKWIGLTNATNSLGYIKQNIQDTLALLPDVDDIHSKLNNLHDQLTTQIQSFYDNNKNSVVRNPDPTQTSPIQPEFIKALGPPSENSTASGALQLEVEIKYKYVSEGLEQASKSINSLKKETDTINEALESAMNLTSSLDGNITNILNDYTTATSSGQNYNSDIGTGIVVFFALGAFISFIIFLGVLNVLTCKSETCLKSMKFARGFLSFVLIVVFIFSMVIFPTLIVATETCNTAEVAFKNETIFTAIAKLFISDYEKSNYSTYAHTCLFGNGDILTDLGVSQQMADLSSVFNQIQNFSGYYNTSLPDSVVIPYLETSIESFQYGLLPVSKPVLQSLIALNSFTNREYSEKQYQCSETGDAWQLNSTNCTAANGTEFTSDQPASFMYGDAVCMSFDQYSNYQPGDRYNGKYSACPAQKGLPYNSIVMGLVGGFKNHMTDVNTVFTAVDNDLNTVNGTNKQFMQEAKSLVEPLVDINNRALELLAFVGNSSTGLLSEFNCLFLQANAQNTIDHVCVAYLPDLFVISICILVFGILALFALFPVFFLEKMYAQDKEKRREEKIRQNEEEHHRILLHHENS